MRAKRTSKEADRRPLSDYLFQLTVARAFWFCLALIRATVLFIIEMDASILAM